MGAPLELIHQLDNSTAHSTDERRSAMLRHLTDLFLVGSDAYSGEEIDLIDDVFVRLFATIEEYSGALRGIQLCPDLCHDRGILAGAAGNPAWPGADRSSKDPAFARL